jgi:hypothetical protein
MTRFLLMFGISASVTLALAWAFQFRIVGCMGYGYGPRTYMASCSAPSYGDYEHGAFAVPTEPSAVRRAQSAQVVIFGHSHSQVAFSSEPTRRFFVEHHIPYYVLAFSGEFGSFYDLILGKMELQPKVVVIDVSPFFTGQGPERMSIAGRFIAEHPLRAAIQYHIKRLWQLVHRASCSGEQPAGLLCGRTFATFRSLDDGTLIADYALLFGSPLPRRPIAVVRPDQISIRNWLANARTFFARYRLEPACTILTAIPSGIDFEEAGKTIAMELGAQYVNPVVEKLYTIDDAHLDGPSAAAWSERFWRQAEPIIERCVS